MKRVSIPNLTHIPLGVRVATTDKAWDRVHAPVSLQAMSISDLVWDAIHLSVAAQVAPAVAPIQQEARREVLGA